LEKEQKEDYEMLCIASYSTISLTMKNLFFHCLCCLDDHAHEISLDLA